MPEDTAAELDWKAVAQIAMQQRDRAEQKANNLEIDLAIAQQRAAALLAVKPENVHDGAGVPFDTGSLPTDQPGRAP